MWLDDRPLKCGCLAFAMISLKTLGWSTLRTYVGITMLLNSMENPNPRCSVDSVMSMGVLLPLM